MFPARSWMLIAATQHKLNLPVEKTNLQNQVLYIISGKK
jgi:hypothetical protein